MQVKNKLKSKHYRSDSDNAIKSSDQNFSQDYVDSLNDVGCTLEKKLPSSKTFYSDLLEDTDWENTDKIKKDSKYYRRDLDAIS